jgi:hypothetical protein
MRLSFLQIKRGDCISQQAAKQAAENIPVREKSERNPGITPAVPRFAGSPIIGFLDPRAYARGYHDAAAPRRVECRNQICVSRPQTILQLSKQLRK